MLESLNDRTIVALCYEHERDLFSFIVARIVGPLPNDLIKKISLIGYQCAIDKEFQFHFVPNVLDIDRVLLNEIVDERGDIVFRVRLIKVVVVPVIPVDLRIVGPLRGPVEQRPVVTLRHFPRPVSKKLRIRDDMDTVRIKILELVVHKLRFRDPIVVCIHDAVLKIIQCSIG